MFFKQIHRFVSEPDQSSQLRMQQVILRRAQHVISPEESISIGFRCPCTSFFQVEILKFFHVGWLNRRDAAQAGWTRYPSLPLEDGKRLLRLAMLPELLALRTLTVLPAPRRCRKDSQVLDGMVVDDHTLYILITYNFDMEYWTRNDFQRFHWKLN